MLDFLKRKKDYEVIDNFLDKTDFLKIQKSFLDNMNCSWHMSDGICETGSSDGVYFIHFLFSDNKIQSHKYSDVFPVMEKAKIKHPERIKVNLYTKNDTLVRHGLHVDSGISMKGCILYLNTNNGFTILDGDIGVKSIENRLLIFDPKKPHSSTNCTDKNYRATINFNYFD